MRSSCTQPTARHLDASTGEKFFSWETFFPRLQNVRRDNIMVIFMRDNHGQRPSVLVNVFYQVQSCKGQALPWGNSQRHCLWQQHNHSCGRQYVRLQPPGYASTLLVSTASTAVTVHTPRAPQLWEIDASMHQMEDLPLRDQVIPSPKDIEPVRVSREGRNGTEYLRTNCGDTAAGIDEAIKYFRPGRKSSREAFKRRAAAGGLWPMATEDHRDVRLFLKDVKESETIYPDTVGALAIYDTNALMKVKRAIAGGFDYGDGLLKISTFSGSSIGATLTGLLRAFSSTTLMTKRDLLLDQELTCRVVKQLKDSIFGKKRLRRLKFNLANHGGPTSDILNHGKRGDALAEILTSGTLQGASFPQVDRFFTRSSTFAALNRIHLSEIHLEANFEPKAHSQKLKNLLHRCSKLEVLGLWCSYAHSGDTVDLVKGVFQGQDTLGFFHLSSPHFKVGAPPPSRIKFAANSSRSSEMRVLHWFGSLIHTLALNDTTTDEEIVILRDCIQQHGIKLGSVDIVISPSTSRLTNIDILQSVILTINDPAGANRTSKRAVACSVAFKSSEILTDRWAHFVGAAFPCLIHLELEMSDGSAPYLYGIGQELSDPKTYNLRGTERVLGSPKAQELIKIVSQSPLLTSLSLRYMHLDSKDWETVLKALGYRRPKFLNLSFTNFSDAPATIMLD
ncbi:hypothetical protein K457DRAFT_123958 [Linnemannia elongata AG-77]|uniref:RNI-like protein n=1 Tax=Linnemannia elongata AG-77 TaxID=1314771 RepID=A0A197K4S4_9FUNG|nr:hypothetical protein K457DRAFT_123958 [Linnemannia elongata AG-77]